VGGGGSMGVVEGKGSWRGVEGRREKGGRVGLWLRSLK